MLPFSNQVYFNSLYSDLYEGFRTTGPAFMHYYSIFIFRRVAFVCMCYFYYEPQYTIIQVVGNIAMSLFYIMYL